MAVTYYVALPFIRTEDGAAPGEAQECQSEAAAIRRTEGMSRDPAYGGDRIQACRRSERWRVFGRGCTEEVRRCAGRFERAFRAIVCSFAEEANLREPEKFSKAWHVLMKGSIVSAGEGNRNAAREAKCAARLVLDGWKRKTRSRLTA